MARKAAFIVVLVSFSAFTALARAGLADVENVRVERAPDGTYTFHVTVRHADEGWSHYADAWQVVLPDGTVAGIRELAHPHTDEQPFTRSLWGVKIPPEIDRVRVRARDKIHGFGGREMTVELPR